MKIHEINVECGTVYKKTSLDFEKSVSWGKKVEELFESKETKKTQ